MNCYWISWIQTPDMPIFESNIPWWIIDMDDMGGIKIGVDERYTICAAIKAMNEKSAIEEIKSLFDEIPQKISFKFVTQKEKGWSPFCNRFKRADWMRWK